MSEYGPNVLIVGAGASQELFGNRFANPELAPEGSTPSITFYDTNPDITLREDLVYLQQGVREGRVKLTHTFPDEKCDVAVIATASDQHAVATLTVLERQLSIHSLPFLVVEKPVVTSYGDLEWFQGLEPDIQDRSLVNEPYFFLEGLRQLISEVRENSHGPLVDAYIWSSKRRNKVNPHGDLGIFAIELPHLHGAASWIANRVLDTDTVQENIYYADVQGIPDNDGNYLRFKTEDTTIHIAQGLGSFVMDRHGKMRENSTPPRTRRIGLHFADDTYVELDVEPAFPIGHRAPEARTITYHYYQGGEDARVIETFTDPRNEVAKHILQRTIDPSLPGQPGTSLHEALQRNVALLNLRRSAEIRYGEQIPS